jgi:uncharacterized protein (TIGR03000 family)
MNKYVLFPVILCCAGLLATATPVHAQRGGRGAPGGFRGGVYPGGVYRGGPYHYGYGYGFGGFGLGIGFYGGYWYDPFWYGPGYGYYYPPTVVVGGPAAIAGMQATPAPVPEGAPKNAQIKVLLPDANAKVWFDGNATTSTGTERIYHTPDLSPGTNPTYRIRAAWIANGKEMIEERIVPVAPGRGSVADFTRPYSEPLPPPPTK